jgi:hypothetical protein
MSEIVLNPKQRNELKDAVNEMNNCLIQMETAREAFNEIADSIQKKFGIKKTIVSRVAKAHHKHSYPTIQMENDQFEYVYESLIGPAKEED